MFKRCLAYRRSQLFATALAVATGCQTNQPETTSRAVLTPPADLEFTYFTCDGAPAFDPVDATSTDDIEIVGDSDFPALYRAVDDDFLYLLMPVRVS